MGEPAHDLPFLATVEASSDPGVPFTVDGPGVAFSASRELALRYDPGEFLDLWTFSDGCEEVGRGPYEGFSRDTRKRMPQ